MYKMAFSIQDIISWYQKKIGTYDKQQWEKSVEQRILSGFTHVPMKTAKLKTEFIDVDLVRGSAFTKTKPKHGLLKVTKLAALRLLLLPFYYNWWICQTSTYIFYFLLLLYILQLGNTALFTCVWITDDPSNYLEHISASEILAPIVMMLILSITHSHIVSTHVKSKKVAYLTGSGGNNNNGTILNGNSVSYRRIKRTKRRNTFTRSRPSHNYNSDNKLLSDVPATTIVETVDTYNKRNRLKSDITEKSSRKRNSSRNVAWDTTPVKVQHKSKERDDDCVACSESSYNINQRVEKVTLLSNETVQQISILGKLQEPESETIPASPSLDDDGFESLDSSGSCDGGTIEDKDISLSVADYETVAINKSPNHKDHNLVNNSFCPKIICSNCNSNNNNNNNNKFKIQNEIDDKSINVDDVLIIREDDVAAPNEHRKDAAIAEVDVGTDDCDEEHRLSKQFYNAAKNHDLEKRTDVEIEQIETDDSETDPVDDHCVNKTLLRRKIGNQSKLTVSVKTLVAESSVNSSGDESEVEEMLSSPGSFGPLLTEGTTSAGEWIGVTTNSEECSYSSEIDDGSDNQYEQQFMLTNDNNDHLFDWDLDMMPNVILSPSNTATGKVSCTMWEKRDVKKANLSVLDISSAIIARVEAMPENMDYLYIGLVMSLILAMIPGACRLTDSLYGSTSGNFYTLSDDRMSSISGLLLPDCPLFIDNLLRILSIALSVLETAFSATLVGNILIIIATFERFCLGAIFFFLLTVAERTFKQRFLYAKFFSHLTSFRRARKSELPHFRLNKVRNIKTWLSVRSYLKKRGPQRSVDVIVSSAFLTTVVLLSFLSVELLKDSEYNIEASGWCLVIGFFMLRFMTLGTKINKKYRNLSTIITEQINLYLQIEQKPNKKEELMVANSVLKLAADLLKELESPFKISGFSANPYLYTVTKVVMLSALSGVLSEFLGFKLKLHKIKIK